MKYDKKRASTKLGIARRANVVVLTALSVPLPARYAVRTPSGIAKTSASTWA